MSDYSMSRRAALAYRDGLMPASKIDRARLDKHGIDLPVAAVKWAIRQGVIAASEWHHTSKKFNRTNFFDLEALAEHYAECPDEKADLLAAWRRAKAAKAAKAAKPDRVKGTYTHWSGRGRYKSREEIDFTGELSADGRWITLDAGGRKAADGNWIEWSRA